MRGGVAMLDMSSPTLERRMRNPCIDCSLERVSTDYDFQCTVHQLHSVRCFISGVLTRS